MISKKLLWLNSQIKYQIKGIAILEASFLVSVSMLLLLLFLGVVNSLSTTRAFQKELQQVLNQQLLAENPSDLKNDTFKKDFYLKDSNYQISLSLYQVRDQMVTLQDQKSRGLEAFEFIFDKNKLLDFVRLNSTQLSDSTTNDQHLFLKETKSNLENVLVLRANLKLSEGIFKILGDLNPISKKQYFEKIIIINA